MENNLKTTDEIEALKSSWLKDPCWDIETTEGFEAHYKELKEFHESMSAKWEKDIELKEQSKRDVWYKLAINETANLDNYTNIRRVPGGWIFTETMCSKEPSSREHDDAEYVMTSTFIPYSPLNGSDK